ncbi:MAG: hypothetical protein AB1374_05985 [Bacillota bacterium]
MATEGKFGAQIEKEIFKGIGGAVDAAVLGAAVGTTMLWNSMQKNVTAWMLGELLVTVLIASSISTSAGLIRSIVFGVEAGAVASFLAPWYAKNVAGQTGVRVAVPAHQAPPVAVSFPAAAYQTPPQAPQKGVGSTAQPVPRGVSVLDV